MFQHKRRTQRVINLYITNSELFVSGLLFAGDVSTVIMHLLVVTDM